MRSRGGSSTVHNKEILPNGTDPPSEFDVRYKNVHHRDTVASIVYFGQVVNNLVSPRDVCAETYFLFVFPESMTGINCFLLSKNVEKKLLMKQITLFCKKKVLLPFCFLREKRKLFFVEKAHCVHSEKQFVVLVPKNQNVVFFEKQNVKYEEYCMFFIF